MVDRRIDTNKLFLIAGPCVVEDEKTPMLIAKQVHELCIKHGIQYIFKASYRKANRSSISSFTGIGDGVALGIIKEIGDSLGIQTTTDIHTEEEAVIAAQYVDVLQIPAFLCRQTSLLQAAANTGKIVNIKKGQFLSPEAMKHVVKKVVDSGNPNVWLTERGTTFGYQDLVVDFKAIPQMNEFAPTIMDCTHALQQPNQSVGVTGGQPQFIETMAKAAVAVGAKGLFIETHPNPSLAKSDGANMLPLEELDQVLTTVNKIYKAVH